MAENDKQLDLTAPAGSQHTLSWEALEFLHREKSASWQVTVWVVGLVLAGGALWYYHLSFFGILSAIVCLSGALALTTQGRLKPKTIRVTINEEGVDVQGTLYPWQDLKRFWLVYMPDNQALYIETTRRVLSVIAIQLGKTDPELVRKTLVAHIPERTDGNEDFSDQISRIIKF